MDNVGKYKIRLEIFLFLWVLILQLRQACIHIRPADTLSHLFLVLLMSYKRETLLIVYSKFRITMFFVEDISSNHYTASLKGG